MVYTFNVYYLFLIMKKLSVKASKAMDEAKNKKVAAMKAKRSESKAVGRAKKLQQSGSMQGKSASYSPKAKTYKMK